MKRRRARVIALILGGLFLLLLAFVLFGGMGRPVRNPGLALQFLGFTNFAGSWFAQMAVTNSSSQQHFVEKAGKMVSFSGWASVRGQNVNLSTNAAVNWPGIIVAESSARFRVSLPEGVEQWQVKAWGYPSSWLTRWSLDKMLDASSPLTRWIKSQSIEALDWIGEVFLEPSARSRFQIESEVFTNVPPSR